MDIYQLLRKSKQIIVRDQSDFQLQKEISGENGKNMEKLICCKSPVTEKQQAVNLLFESHCEIK